VKMVIAKSIARIHKGNLINHGIIPMVFAVISYLIYAKAYKLKGDYLNNMVKELNVVHEA